MANRIKGITVEIGVDTPKPYQGVSIPTVSRRLGHSSITEIQRK
ncbi:hypothetical protein [uncultured Ruminococcus sp.]|nr:hypothetical protein [uncultured Ruminococcus sp.]